ncbi:class I adenylate-forming enzyme family protein [Mycobacterium sp.]|uniref:class I adenylate-forming enzyme family protein n=1 Tax=Mycobacterium sp. TaxID=1785 RepID=UPI003D099E29
MTAVAAALARGASERWGDRECTSLDDDRLTFTQLDTWADQVARNFIDAGVAPADRVLVLLPNCLEILPAVCAAWRIGAVATPVVAIYRQHELRSIVREVQPAVVVTAVEFAGRSMCSELDDCFDEIGFQPVVKYATGLNAGQATSWRPFPGRNEASGPSISIPMPSEPDAECLRLYTSGSTSAPKGVRLSSTAVIAGALQYQRSLDFGPDDVSAVLSPLAHVAGLLGACLVPLTSGIRSVVLRRWNPRAAVDLIDREKATWSLGAATFLHDIVKEYDESDRPLHKLHYFVCGGARTPPELIERADEHGIKAFRAYGMTECAGNATFAEPTSSLSRRAHWDGQINPGVDIRIVDPSGALVAEGEEGVIEIGGAQVMLGYCDPELTAQQMREGWFDTGDVGRVSPDGWVQITGRTKEIINRGGEKFSVKDIEEVLTRHPDVEAAAVIGVHDDRLGEAVCAYVVPNKGSSSFDPKALADFMIEAHMTKAKIPTEWHQLESLPISATGKVQKHLLRQDRS